MEFTATTRSYIATFIGLLVALIVFLFAPSVRYTPQGIFLPSAKAEKPVSADDVHFYSAEGTPLLYKKIGRVNIEMHADELTMDARQQVLRMAQNLAAANGGTGIVPARFFLGNSGPSVLSTIVFQGDVIYSVGGN